MQTPGYRPGLAPPSYRVSLWVSAGQNGSSLVGQTVGLARENTGRVGVRQEKFWQQTQ